MYQFRLLSDYFILFYRALYVPWHVVVHCVGFFFSVPHSVCVVADGIINVGEPTKKLGDLHNVELLVLYFSPNIVRDII